MHTLAAAGQNRVTFSDGKLTVMVNRASLLDVITAVSEETGTSIYIFDDASCNEVTVELKDRSFKSALRSILRGVNYAVVYEVGFKNGSVTWIEGTEGKKGNIRKNKFSELRTAGKSGTSSRKKVVSTMQDASRSSFPGGSNTLSEKKQSETGNDAVKTEYIYGSRGSLSANNEINTGETDAVSGSTNASTGNVTDRSESNGFPSWYYEGMSSEEVRIMGKIDLLESQIESGYADRHYDHWVKLRGAGIVRHASELIEEYEERLEKLQNR